MKHSNESGDKCSSNVSTRSQKNEAVFCGSVAGGSCRRVAFVLYNIDFLCWSHSAHCDVPPVTQGQTTDRFNEEQGFCVCVCVSGGREELGVPHTRASNCIIQIN